MTIYKSPWPQVPVRDISITDRIFENLATRPDEIVLTDGPSGRSTTAAAFMDQVRSLAGGLLAQGLVSGKVIALMAPNMPEYCVIFHAIAYAGGTITTLNPTYTASEVRHQLNDSGASLLMTIPMFADVAAEGIKDTGVTRIAMIGEDSLTALMGDPLAAQVPVDLASHVLALPYSSGTTGLPKGVMLSHRNLVVNTDQIILASEFRPGEVAAGFLPFFHIYGMTLLMNVHLGGGGAVVTMPRFDLEMFLRINAEYRSRRMWIVPPVALALAKHPLVDQFDLSALEQVFSGAAPLGADLSNAVSARLDCICLQGYGMTELSPASHVTPASAARAGGAGQIVPNTRCRIVDIRSGQDLGPGETGELWVKGPQVMLGYLNNAKATGETLDDNGWLRTGDIAFIDDEGYTFIVDRLKELIKFKGFQVAPAELEAALVAMDGISDAAVIGRHDEAAGEVPVGFVVIAESGPSPDQIMARLTETLAPYKQLHAIHVVTEIPKSASGKILRRLLRDRLNAA